MKVYGSWSGHDCSFAVLDNGVPKVHAEYERYIREKEPRGDSVQFMFDELGSCEDIKYFATCHSIKKLKEYEKSFKKLENIIEKNDGEMYILGHHQSHAANAFFSSNFDKSLIITIDGGGLDTNPHVESQTLKDVQEANLVTAFTVWSGEGNKIKNLLDIPISHVNIGGIWTRCTRYIFKLNSGWPYGHQAGSVMAMAALGDPDKYFEDFYRMFKYDNHLASVRAPGQPAGCYTENDPKHPYLNKWAIIADESEQSRFDIAAALQKATEVYLKELIGSILDKFPEYEHICFSGGVTLNSVAMGKMLDWFDDKIKDIYVTPTPHDGGLPIGAAQYVWHQILDNPRVDWQDNCPAYLGLTYNNVQDKVEEYKDKIEYVSASMDDVVKLLDEQKIVAVFGGGSESGRRALGNRSILADPRSPKMKDQINEKVKHRQWYRPFAPSILREEVQNWFVRDKNSPYMSFVLKFKKEKATEVPAVVHFDDTARLQTVTEKDNNWYYSLIKKWYKLSGVPILLNTSFNDREPICETPEHAINCFLRTNIDYLYFYDKSLLVKKK